MRCSTQKLQNNKEQEIGKFVVIQEGLSRVVGPFTPCRTPGSGSS